MGPVAHTSSKMRQGIKGSDLVVSEATSISSDAVGAARNGASHAAIRYRGNR